MLDKLKSALGLDVTPKTTNNPETDANNETPEEEPEFGLTQDDLLRQYLQQIKSASQSELQRYQEELNALLNTQIPQTQPNYGVAQQPNQQPPAEQEETLPEDATVQDLVSFLTKKISREIEQRMAALMQQQMQQMPFKPAAFIVDQMVREHPALESVAEEGRKLLEKLPPQYQNRDTADFILWWLKGKRAEAEKKETLAGLFESAQPQPTAEALPYTNEEIANFAATMGIDPKTLKKRLVEEMLKANKQ
jgi:hypothetical protein